MYMIGVRRKEKLTEIRCSIKSRMNTTNIIKIPYFKKEVINKSINI